MDRDRAGLLRVVRQGILGELNLLSKELDMRFLNKTLTVTATACFLASACGEIVVKDLNDGSIAVDVQWDKTF